jgi:hypothetical protein
VPLAACWVSLAVSVGRLQGSFWRDEAASLWLARLPLSSLLAGPCDPHPPGYYLLLKAWLAGGQGEPWLRLPSLLAAVLGVALAYRLGREVCGPGCAGLAALLLAGHPLQSWYAGEARMYALAQAMGLLVAWLGWRLLSGSAPQRGYRRTAAAYWLAGVLGLGIDYAALLPIGGLSLVWLARGRPETRRWLSLQAAVLLAAAGLWVRADQLQALRQSYLPILMAIQASRLGLDLEPAAAVRLLQLAVLGLVWAGVGLAWYWPRLPMRGRGGGPAGWALAGGVWLGLLVLAGLPRAYTLKRQAVVLLPYLALWVAHIFARLPHPGLHQDTPPGRRAVFLAREPGGRPFQGELAAGLGLLVTLLALPNHQREPWRAVVADLVASGPEPAAVVWVDDLAVPAFEYYLPHSQAESGGLQWTPLVGQHLPRLPDVSPQPGDTLWIVTAESVYRHLEALLPAAFYADYQLIEERHEPGIGVYRYRRRLAAAPDPPQVPVPGRPAAWGLLLPSPLTTCRPQ